MSTKLNVYPEVAACPRPLVCAGGGGDEEQLIGFTIWTSCVPAITWTGFKERTLKELKDEGKDSSGRGLIPSAAAASGAHTRELYGWAWLHSRSRHCRFPPF